MNFVTVNVVEAAIHPKMYPTLIAVQKAVQSCDWTDKLVKPSLNVIDEIAVDNNNSVVL